MSKINKTFPLKYSEPKSALVNIRVNDMDRAIKFYEDTFNFGISWSEGKDLGWIELKTYIDGFYLGLNKTDQEITESHVVFTMNVQDVDEAKNYLDSKNVQTTDINEFPGLTAMFYCIDSEGNKIAIAGPADE